MSTPALRWFFSCSWQQRSGVALLFALLAFAVGERLVHAGDPALQNLSKVLAAPSLSEPFGTDHFGRSMLSRMGAAMRLSLSLSVLCVVSSALLGVTLGLVAGWRRASAADRVLSFGYTMLTALPGLVSVLLFVALAPGSLLMIYVAIAMVSWVDYFRMTRAVTQTVVGSAAMQASQLLGFSRWYCVKRHLWPALRSQTFTLAAFGTANSILALASLGFVSVGVRPPTAELGLMMVELLPYYSDAPWVLAQPLLAVFLLILACNLLAGERSQ
jgi:peptide/nickel transport system permease protein